MEDNFVNSQMKNSDLIEAEEVSDTAEVAEAPAESKKTYEELFTPEEIKLIEEYAGKINITDENILAGYGVAVQKKASDIAAAAVLGSATKNDSTALGLMDELVKLIGDMESPEGEKSLTSLNFCSITFPPEAKTA